MKTVSRHPSEEELIAYQLQETTDAGEIARHLELCVECADASASIAETLRVFSAEPVPQANVEHAWQRLRGSLPARAAAKSRRSFWRTYSAWLIPALMVIVAIVFAGSRLLPRRGGNMAATSIPKPGPLTARPSGPTELTDHLDSAERLLTEVNHASGPLSGTASAQAHALLLSNAVYVQQASANGDAAQAALLEDLGRVLTALDHEQPATGKGWHVRLEMNTDGLLLDLRILQQNDQQADRKGSR